MVWFNHRETVGTSVVPVVEYAKERKALRLFNGGPGSVWLGPNRGVSTGNGDILQVGGVLPLNKKDGDEIHLAIFSISDIAGNTVYVREDFPSPPGK